MNADQRLFSVNLRLVLYALEIIVEHSSMTNQTHLFRQFRVSRPDQGAAPRTGNIECRLLRTLQIVVARIDTLTQSNLPD